MATLDWNLSRHEGVTLVELQVCSDAAERVRIDSALDPVWPPRRQGLPDSGWDDGSVEGVVTPEAPLVVGYASPANPREPPARIVETDPAPSDASPGPVEDSVTPRALVRTLGDATPPRDAVPDGSADASTPAADRGGTVPDRRAEDSSDSGVVNPPPAAPPEADRGATDGDPAVEAWLDGVERRLSAAEDLTAVSSVADAREALDAVGGIDEVTRLQRHLDRDERALGTVRERCNRLLDRADATSVPVETLERVR